MNIDQLKCFVILSETLSFTHTAEIIHLTQPAITHQIKKLESLLKLKLFIRNKQGVQLTAVGKLFYPEAKDILTRLQIAIGKASSLNQGRTEVISIGYEGHDLEKHNLPNIINIFKKTYPQTKVMVYRLNHKERKIAIQNQKVDLILTTKDNIESTENVIYKQIMSCGLDCVINKTSPLSEKSLMHIEDIQQENIILYDPLQGPKEFNLIQDKLLQLFPDSYFTYADSEYSASIMIKCNEGIAIMPSFCRQLNNGLKQIPFIIDEQLSYGVAYLKGTPNRHTYEISKIIKENFDVTIGL